MIDFDTLENALAQPPPCSTAHFEPENETDWLLKEAIVSSYFCKSWEHPCVFIVL